MSMPNDSVFVEYDPLPIRYNVYWIPIDCDTLPMAQVGIAYAFWCDGCSGCKPSVVSTGTVSYTHLTLPTIYSV